MVFRSPLCMSSLQHVASMPTTPQLTPTKIKWEIGSSCRSMFEAKGSEHECQIVDINLEKGKAKVKFLGYEDIVIVQLSQLLPSRGDKARRAQIEAVQAAVPVKAVNPAELTSSKAQPVKPAANDVPKPDLPTKAAPAQEAEIPKSLPNPKAVDQPITPVARPDPTLPNDIQALATKSPSVQEIRTIFTPVQTKIPAVATKPVEQVSTRAALRNDFGSPMATLQKEFSKSNNSILSSSSGPNESTPRNVSSIENLSWVIFAAGVRISSQINV